MRFASDFSIPSQKFFLDANTIVSVIEGVVVL